jgi:crossover junction endodeoxyribonuclease RusA
MLIELPYPPSVNHYWGSRGNRRFILHRGQEFRASACAIVRAAGVPTLGGRLLVDTVVCPPDRRRRDLDNVHKAMLDALEHAGVYEDDSQIDVLPVWRGAVVPGGTVTVQIHAVTDDQRQRLRAGWLELLHEVCGR